MKTSVVLIHLYLIGRTGITAITIAFGFLVSIFFSPIFASFPPWATGPALIVVGCMMTTSVRHINWDYPGGSYIITSVFWGRAHHSTVSFIDAIPAFLTIAVMSFTQVSFPYYLQCCLF